MAGLGLQAHSMQAENASKSAANKKASARIADMPHLFDPLSRI